MRYYLEGGKARWKVEAGKTSKFGLLTVVGCEMKWFKGLSRPVSSPTSTLVHWGEVKRSWRSRVEDALASVISCCKLNWRKWQAILLFRTIWERHGLNSVSARKLKKIADPFSSLRSSANDVPNANLVFDVKMISTRIFQNRALRAHLLKTYIRHWQLDVLGAS